MTDSRQSKQVLEWLPLRRRLRENTKGWMGGNECVIGYSSRERTGRRAVGE
jgi:hypothetical protein